MFIPLKDLNPRRSFPFVNTALILVNVAAFLYQAQLPVQARNVFVLANATIPARFSSALSGHSSLELAFLGLLTSMFLHSGIAHIAGNMLFLWIFGDNVEDYFGHIAYLVFYLACGLVAALLHVFFNFNSMLPALGASGAISGVMGAYALLYPRARVLTLVFVFLLPLPALLILGLWFAMQFLEGINALGSSAAGGVAWWAHVGGFLTGLFITMISRGSSRARDFGFGS
ncbi:MAG TPA: rhomboid family intramembrane serine protease [Candidatus Saccharimonadales bacterium]|nr:rhomboid family intramembrane serine protease [Candidatus Saccharimonadales bacterium]